MAQVLKFSLPESSASNFKKWFQKQILYKGQLLSVVWVGSPVSKPPIDVKHIFIAQRSKESRFDPLTSDFVFLVHQDKTFRELQWVEMQTCFGTDLKPMELLSKNIVPVKVRANKILLPVLPACFFKHIINYTKHQSTTKKRKRQKQKARKTKLYPNRIRETQYDEFIGWRMCTLSEFIRTR